MGRVAYLSVLRREHLLFTFVHLFLNYLSAVMGRYLFGYVRWERDLFYYGYHEIVYDIIGRN